LTSLLTKSETAVDCPLESRRDYNPILEKSFLIEN